MRGRPSPAARGRTPRFWGLAVPDAQKDSGLMVVVHVGEEASSDRRGRDGYDEGMHCKAARHDAARRTVDGGRRTSAGRSRGDWLLLRYTQCDGGVVIEY
ncbi:hypothetical protein VTO73DRAFT_5920 [Trametes versicolor]